MTDVFTDVTYIWFAVAMVFLYAFIHAWIFYFEEHKLKKLDFIYFVGNLVNQPFPESIKVGKFLDNGQLISKFPFDVFKSAKKPTKLL